jgi:predicted DNA-binding transcriptional regulator AlpA
VTNRTKVRGGEPLLDFAWFISYVKVKPRTAYSWRERGTGPPCYRVGGQLRFRQSEVDQWLAERRDAEVSDQ